MSKSLPGSLCTELPESQKQWFYAEGGSAHKKAAAVCAECPVKAACLDLAMDLEGRGIGVFRGNRYGVWGGVSGRARTRMAKALA
jgi:hypothetical protein